MQPTTPTPGTIFVVWLIVIVAVGFVTMMLFKIAVWWGSGVNDNTPAPARVMSRSEDSTPVHRLSSKDGQSDGRTDSLVYERTELLMLYKLLRKHGISREEARPILKAIRIPLSNDVWAAAAPPEEETVHRTPIVGRPTSARFETDPDFPYQAPA